MDDPKYEFLQPYSFCWRPATFKGFRKWLPTEAPDLRKGLPTKAPDLKKGLPTRAYYLGKKTAKQSSIT